jgi:hypothetical protein
VLSEAERAYVTRCRPTTTPDNRNDNQGFGVMANPHQKMVLGCWRATEPSGITVAA